MATYYIDPAGSDSTGDGSSGNPWASLDHAKDNSADTDTIIANAGTFTMQADDINQNLGARTVQGAGMGQTIFDYSGITIGNAQYVMALGSANGAGLVKDITMQNIGYASTPYTQFRISDNREGTFLRCEFRNMYGCPSTYGGLIGNDHTGSADSSITMTVQNCIFYDTIGYYIIIMQGTNNTINWYNNVVYQENNALIGAVLDMNGSNNDLNIVNSIFRNNSGVTTPLYTVSTGASLDYSCQNGWSNTISGTGNITTDPLFVDEANEDFRLQLTSPCLNTGTIV